MWGHFLFPVSALTAVLSIATACSDLLLTGIVDGTRSGGLPKAVELYANVDIADLSAYGIGSANNGGGTDGEEFTFPADSVTAGSFIYVASESENFEAFFGFLPDYSTSAVNVNGDDAIELFKEGAVIDIYGDPDGLGDADSWGYTDGWGYRISSTDVSVPFDGSLWTYSGLSGDVNPDIESNGFPIGTYTCNPAPAEPISPDPTAPTSTPSTNPSAPTSTPSNTLTGALVSIEDIQGDGETSSLVGESVFVAGATVTAIMYNGFFMQQEDVDPNKSSGIFVFTSSTPSGIAKGDIVDVSGTVSEYYDETQLSSATFEVVGSGTVFDPVEIELPVDSMSTVEKYEGMLVSITTPAFNTLVVSEYYNLDAYGTIVACSADSSVGRIFQYTQLYAPDVTGYSEALDLVDRSCIAIDDNSGGSNPNPILVGGLYELTTSNTLRGGTSVDTLVGGLRYSFGIWTIHPLAEEDLVFGTSDSPRDEALNQVSALTNNEDELRIVSANVLNYFTSLDTTGNTTFRGADNQEEYDRQEEKMLTALTMLNADIYGIIEIENIETNDASLELVSELNADAGATREYASVSVEAGLNLIGTDAIKVDIIYDKMKMTLVGTATLTDDDVDPSILSAVEGGAIFNGKSRVPLAATFLVGTTYVTVVANHYKSKSSSGATGVEADQGDGASSWNNLRTKTSEALLAWLETDPTGTSTDNIVLLGDFNAYAAEQPVTSLKSAGYVDVDAEAAGTNAVHSYVFDGQWGTLDYIFASQPFADNLLDVFAWHVNSDEPDGLDYNTENRDTSIFDGSMPFRFSDHDPLVATFSVDAVNLPSAPPSSSLNGGNVSIEDIQGDGETSPLVGESVFVAGATVTAIMYNGFFMQQEDVDPNKSSGVFVFTSSTPSGIAKGDIVDVSGTVSEYYDETQLSSATFEVVGSGTVFDPVEIELPVDSMSTVEKYEGMLVSITTPASNTLVVSEYYNLDAYGTIVACSADSSDGRIFQYTQLYAPDVTGYSEALDLVDRSCIAIDDNSGGSNPNPILVGGLYELTTSNTLRGGTSVDTLVGGLRYSFGIWTIHPLAEEDLVFGTSDSPRDEALNQVSALTNNEDELRIVSANVLNYFTSLDTTGNTTFRGADNQEEYDRQEEKMLTALTMLNADIYGIIEIENIETNDASLELVSELNADAGATREYASVSVEAGLNLIGTDAIEVDIIYDKMKMTLVGTATLTDDDVDSSILSAVEGGAIFNGKSRVPLAATFLVGTTYVTVVANHYKSKSSSGATGVEADQGDGASSWNNLRTKTSEALLAWLETDPTGTSTDNIVLLGDFNAYAAEQPVTTLKSAGYVDVDAEAAGTNAVHSYVFDGQWGTLDYIFASQPFADNLLDVFAWHVNSDEPDGLDYNTENRDTSIFDGSVPFRFSDHDPLVATFSVDAVNLPSAPPSGAPSSESGAVANLGSIYFRLAQPFLLAHIISLVAK